MSDIITPFELIRLSRTDVELSKILISTENLEAGVEAQSIVADFSDN